MRRNNKALYEQIMRTVSKQVKRALNESMITESWGGLNDNDNAQWDEWWDEYVPDEGKCDTVGGEIMRAMARLVYRFYNDGDTVEEYWGSEYNHCRAADEFLLKNVYGYKSLQGIWDENEYEKQLNARLKFVFDFLNENPDIFEQDNTKDFLDLAPFEPHRDDEDDEDDYWPEDDEDDEDNDPYGY